MKLQLFWRERQREHLEKKLKSRRRKKEHVVQKQDDQWVLLYRWDMKGREALLVFRRKHVSRSQLLKLFNSEYENEAHITPTDLKQLQSIVPCNSNHPHWQPSICLRFWSTKLINWLISTAYLVRFWISEFTAVSLPSPDGCGDMILN